MGMVMQQMIKKMKICRKNGKWDNEFVKQNIKQTNE